MGDETILRRHMRFHGWVQGVGFRWRARHAANLYGATGWVRNEPDGTMTMELQGTEEQLDQVLRAIERGAYVKIERMEARRAPVDPEERGFRAE